MKKPKDKIAKAGPVELSEKELGEVAGGLEVKLQDVVITSYQVGATGDGTPDLITYAGSGGGPHVKVFNGSGG